MVKWLYSDKVKEHFFSPKNIVHNPGEVKDFNGVGEVGNPVCGDVMKIYIKVENDIIIDCKWQTFGCASAIASTSALSEMVKGMNINEAKKITGKDIVEKLGGLPNQKIHCSILGHQALKKAIENYQKNNKQ
jgi:NifU-like protein involved in Fe-S cluster formation